MWFPTVRGIIDRRILVNYSVDPEILAPLLPPPFRPQVYHGCGLAGICLIRLATIRPRFLPGLLGISSENAAHRIAVEWDESGTVRHGVYVRRRDTDSRLNCLAGGRLFPGVHHHATFAVDERGERFRVSVASDDGLTRILVRGHRADRLPADSVFESLRAASDFFAAGSIG
jgi:uncharacterized protein YqjF (DUF2071 family)